MPELTVPGAIIHYEKFGIGNELLILISGADGRGNIFFPCAKYLTAYFTVVCWDRRGYSQSLLTSRQDFQRRLQTDADDAARLIKHLSRDGTAIVFGTSSGAVVAQELLATHPDCVAKVIAHEPLAFSVLPEQVRVQAHKLIDSIYTSYRHHGPIAAMEIFTSVLSEGPESKLMRHCMDVKRSDEIRANCLFWFEFELRQYTSATVNFEALRKERNKLILVAGEDSGDGPTVGPTKVIAVRLCKEVLRTPGAHLGFLIKPEYFAKRLVDLIRGGDTSL